jgi:hypothetical protein
MNNLTREQILEKYNKISIQGELSKYNILFDNNLSKEQLLDLYFSHTFEKRKIYTAEELESFSVNTVYSLCKRLGITNFAAKGFIPQYQKANLIIEYLSYIRTCSSEQLCDLSEDIYPSNGRFIRTDFLEDLELNEVLTLNVNTIDTYIITEAITKKYRYIKTDTTTIDCIEFLYYATTEVLDNILIQMGNYPINNLGFDDKICLIIWHILYNTNYTFDMDPEFSVFIEKTDSETLKSRIVGDYKYPEDYATMLWIVNTKCKPPIIQNHLGDKYAQLLQLSGPEINHLGYAYDFLPTSKYRTIALHKGENLLKDYILALNTPEYLKVVKANLGIILPPTLKVSEFDYLKKNLIYYQKILIRRKESGLPPTTKCSISDLQWYTDAELFTFYDLSTIRTFDNRQDLLQRICYLLKANHYWHLEYVKSANPNLHVIMQEQREIEEDNPIICFGNLIYYKAYNIDELCESFKHYDDDGFRFKVPDGNGYTPDFTVSEIHKLINFLKLSFPGAHTEFIERSIQGILFLGNINTRLIKIKEYCKDEHFKNCLIKFCGIIFTLSMKMKKWKGSPQPYPLEWKEQKDIELLKTRDDNTEIALSDYIQFIDSLEGALKIKICEIPRISYNFQSAEMRIGYETINSILELVSGGNFCLAHASDILLQSVYIIWIKILGYNLRTINVQLRKYLGCDSQPDFDPQYITVTGHRDPVNKLIDF